jgi:hypothetical protein
LAFNGKGKSHRGNASRFFVAGGLRRRGYAAVVTLGNTPNTDILCSNRAGTRFVHIQVKTIVPGAKTCSVGVKAERQFGDVFFWVLAGIPVPESDRPFEYFIIPGAEMARNLASYYQSWLSQAGKKGQPRNDNAVRAVAAASGTSNYFCPREQFRDRWGRIERVLEAWHPDQPRSTKAHRLLQPIITSDAPLSDFLNVRIWTPSHLQTVRYWR